MDLFSQESEVLTSRLNGRDLQTSSTASGKNSLAKSSSTIFPTPNNMKTSKTSTQLNIEDELMFSAEDSLAKMQALPNKTEKDKKDLKATGQGYGRKWFAPSKKYNPNTSSPKTYRIFSEPTMDEIGEQSSVNWMEWGTMQSGELHERAKSVLATTVPGATWLLTPTASDSMRENLSSPMYFKRYHRSAGSLPEHLHRLGFRGKVNPLFPGWMMGFPKNWTALPFQSGEENQSKHTETR